MKSWTVLDKETPVIKKKILPKIIFLRFSKLKFCLSYFDTFFFIFLLSYFVCLFLFLYVSVLFLLTLSTTTCQLRDSRLVPKGMIIGRVFTRCLTSHMYYDWLTVKPRCGGTSCWQNSFWKPNSFPECERGKNNKKVSIKS